MLVYLFGVLIGAVVWSIIFSLRKDLRKPMIWSGIFYIFYVSLLYWTWYILSLYFNVGSALNPYYWQPETILNLNEITKGYSIEDVLFMFFAGGMATGVYELFSQNLIRMDKEHSQHIRAIVGSYVASIFFMFFFKLNFMYTLIFSGFAGSMIVWADRKDLIKHSVLGGFCTCLVYTAAFLTFTWIFPGFISEFYSLQHIRGPMIIGIPLEEYLYAFGLGMFWAPLYEYEHGYVNVEK